MGQKYKVHEGCVLHDLDGTEYAKGGDIVELDLTKPADLRRLRGQRSKVFAVSEADKEQPDIPPTPPPKKKTTEAEAGSKVEKG